MYTGDAIPHGHNVFYEHRIPSISMHVGYRSLLELTCAAKRLKNTEHIL